jgi:hypothetical protein
MPVMQYQTFKTREIQQTECEKLRRQVGEGGKIPGEKISSSTAHNGSFFLNSIEKYNKYRRRSCFVLTSSFT